MTTTSNSRTTLCIRSLRRCGVATTAALVFLLAGNAALTMPTSAATSVSTIYVANAAMPSSISVINSGTNKLTKSIPVPGGVAVSVAVAPGGKEAYALISGNDEEGSPGSLLPISTATNTTGRVISVGTDPQSITFNPKGTFAYVVDGFDAATTALNTPGTVTPINLAQGVADKPIKVGSNPGSMAITPDGTTAYVASSNPTNGVPTTITPINLKTNTAEKSIPIGARTISVSLNGQTAFALGPKGVIPIDTATNTPEKSIDLGGTPQAIALSPDGQTAWVLAGSSFSGKVGSGKMTLSAINTSTNAIGKVVTLSGMPQSGEYFVALTANGTAIYVLGQSVNKSAGILTSVNSSTFVVQKPITTGIYASGLVVNPNNKFVYVLTAGTQYQGPPITPEPKNMFGTVTPVNATTGKIGTAINVGFAATAIAITP